MLDSPPGPGRRAVADQRADDDYRRPLVAAAQRFSATLGDAARWQERIRTAFLRENADTAFGREHSFARVRSLAEYRRAVPLRTYAEYAPWVARAAAGEEAVLTRDEPRLFFTTSGSTGARKRVPVTGQFLTRVYLPFFEAAMGVPARFFPDALSRGAATLNLRHDRLAHPATTASGRPSLGPSQADLAAGGQGAQIMEPGALAPWSTLPVAVDDHAYLDKLYLRVRMAAEHDVRCVIGHNPAMIAMLPQLLRDWWPQLLRDVHEGTYLGRPGATPDRRRAAELEQRAAHAGGPTPAVVWPRIRLLYCWTSGVARLYLPRLKELYGVGVTVLPTPPAASEGPVAIPVDRHPTAGPLAASLVLYEFVDAAEDVLPGSPTLLFDELENGRDYHVILSHVGGLYRYVLGDVVHVVDHVAGVPRVEYAGRATLSDQAGERLREFHLVRAMAEASRHTGLDIVNVTCATEAADGREGAAVGVRYVAAVALRADPEPSELAAFAGIFDRELRRTAPGYDAARVSGALTAPRVLAVPATAFQDHWHRRVAAGMRPPEVKDQILQTDPVLWRTLIGASGESGTAGR